MPNNLSVGCAIITHRAKSHLPFCLPPLLKSSLKPRVLVVNSSSNDGTVEMAQTLGAETLVIPRANFNHGTTREQARKHLATDIVCFITPDAYLENADTLHRLVRPLMEGQASIAYGRQTAHAGADFFEAFPREYNYPSNSHIRSLEHSSHFGVYTFFCSNSFAAYLNAALEEIGGFSHVLLGEDTLATAKLLRKNHQIAYVAEAIARHSHRYSLWQEFRRSFDTGLARKSYAEFLTCEGSDSKRGLDYTKKMVQNLWKSAPQRLPYGSLHILCKWLGYQLGKNCHKAPLWVKKSISTQDFYWK